MSGMRNGVNPSLICVCSAYRIKPGSNINLKNKDMKVIKIIVLGLGLLVIYPIVLVNRITIKSVKVEMKTADYVEYFCKSFN